MSDEKKDIIYFKKPTLTRVLVGGLMAFGVSMVMNPAFAAIAVLVILLIPVLTVDNMFARQFDLVYKSPLKMAPKKMTKSEYQAMQEAKTKSVEKK